VVVPDLADARARKDQGAIREALRKTLVFPALITLAALGGVGLFGETLLAIFGPEFTDAKVPLLILMACQLARALFGPSVSLLTVIGAQWHNAALAVASLVVLAIGNVVLTPLYGVLGAAIAVAVATVFWLVACAIVLGRLSGLRTDVLYLIGKLGSPRSAPGLTQAAAVKLDGPRPLELLVGLLGREERGEEQPQHEGRDGQKRDGAKNLAEM